MELPCAQREPTPGRGAKKANGLRRFSAVRGRRPPHGAISDAVSPLNDHSHATASLRSVQARYRGLEAELVIFRSRLDIVIADRLGVWQFTAAVVGICLAVTLAVTGVSDYFEGNSLLAIAVDAFISLVCVGLLALPLAYYAARSNLALYEAKCEAERSSLTDPLTGLMNRRAFMRMSECEGGAKQALVVFDIDRFKRINDAYGHQAGDAVICQVAAELQSVLGAAGEVARVGGEEFALLAPPCAYDDLVVRLIDLRARIESMPIAIDGGVIRTTISAGVALRAPGENFANLYRRADQALYAAKKAGRNCLRLNAGRSALEPLEAVKVAFPA
jgi:diguanylate cyclase (GGDEF)-like protein